MNAWNLQPEYKADRAQECVVGVISRLRAILQRDGDDVATRLEPDSVEMLALQLKLASAHLLAAAQALREVEHERRVLADLASQHEGRIECEWDRAETTWIDQGI